MGSHVGLNFVGGRRGTDSDMHCPYPFPALGGQGSSDAVISNVGLDNVGMMMVMMGRGMVRMRMD